MIVLDTNVLSELMKAKPAENVSEWAGSQPASSLFITAITQAEILYGIRLLPNGRRRNSIAIAAEAMFNEDFNDRILAFNSDAAAAYADIAVMRRNKGKPISQFDAQGSLPSQNRRVPRWQRATSAILRTAYRTDQSLVARLQGSRLLLNLADGSFSSSRTESRPKPVQWCSRRRDCSRSDSAVPQSCRSFLAIGRLTM